MVHDFRMTQPWITRVQGNHMSHSIPFKIHGFHTTQSRITRVRNAGAQEHTEIICWIPNLEGTWVPHKTSPGNHMSHPLPQCYMVSTLNNPGAPEPRAITHYLKSTRLPHDTIQITGQPHFTFLTSMVHARQDPVPPECRATTCHIPYH
jgi:hypothetical protein